MISGVLLYAFAAALWGLDILSAGIRASGGVDSRNLIAPIDRTELKLTVALV